MARRNTLSCKRKARKTWVCSWFSDGKHPLVDFLVHPSEQPNSRTLFRRRVTRCSDIVRHIEARTSPVKQRDHPIVNGPVAALALDNQ